MARDFHERLQQHHRLTVAGREVLRQACCRQRQHLRGEVAHPHPGQQEKPRVVEHPPQVRLARGGIPTDPAVARGHLPRRRPAADGPQHPVITGNQTTQLRPRQRGVAQGVIACEQPVPQARSALLTHRFQAQPAQLPDRAPDGHGFGPALRTPYQPPPIAIAPARWRQLDQPRPMQPQPPHLTWALISAWAAPRASVQSNARKTRRALSARRGGCASIISRRIRSRSAASNGRPHSLLGISTSISSRPIRCDGAGFQQIPLSVSSPLDSGPTEIWVMPWPRPARRTPPAQAVVPVAGRGLADGPNDDQGHKRPRSRAWIRKPFDRVAVICRAGWRIVRASGCVASALGAPF
jgi:hypothetical protein